MLGLDGEFEVSENSPRDGGIEVLGGVAGDAQFDASQYEFFGKIDMEEIELGDLDDEGAEADFVSFGGGDYTSSTHNNGEEGEMLGFPSEIDDLANSLLKLNKAVEHTRSSEAIGDGRSFYRESSSAAADWAIDLDLASWPDQLVSDAVNVQDGKRCWSHQHPSSSPPAEAEPLHRTSSFPYGRRQQQQQQQQQQNMFDEQVPLAKSSFISYPPHGGLSQGFPTLSDRTNISIPSAGLQGHFCAQNVSAFSGSQPHLADFHHGLNYGGNMAQFLSPFNNQEGRQSGMLSADRSILLPGLYQQNLSHQSIILPSQKPGFQNVQFSQLPPQLFGPHPSPHMMNKLEEMLGMAELRDQGLKTGESGRQQNMRFSHHPLDTGNHKSSIRWPQYRSNYMSSKEIESIMRMQHAATHSSDPYADDYYHQACLSKRSSGTKLRHHFCPISIRNLPSSSRANNEPHAYLEVDGLGRISFSSVRRPRPLLDVDSPSSAAENSFEHKSSMKPLEQEVMLEARITIEDGLCLLLDVDDIDRLVQFNPPHDGDSELKRRRQILLEGLAASLHLVDPLDPGKAGQPVGIASKDDLIFLRTVSLPKGRKLLSRFLLMLYPGSDLTRIVCMAIFRHLRFLFGSLLADPVASETTSAIARSVSLCVCWMDLNALSACLAAVACSSEQPPLRPIGSAAGDGASVVIRSVVERATEVLKDHRATSICSIRNRALWQESFDAFFGLLLKYCLSKYESITQFLNSQASAMAGSEATHAIHKEMPIELLRASLPHTDDHQRKLLLELAQRSMPVSGYSAYSDGCGPAASESVSA